LPSTAPPAEDEDEDADEAGEVAGWVAGGALVLPLPPLELQAASANAATTPIAAMGTLLLRMQDAFPCSGRQHRVLTQP
jgi:hypothetical protein